MALPDAAIFDNDGLLLDTEQAWTRAERTLFAERGRTFTAEHKRSLLGSAHPAAARKLEAMLELPGRGTELMAELQELVMGEALAGVAPRPGALALLERLGRAQVSIGLASNSRREFVERTLASAGLLPGPFATIVCVEDVAHPKPAPDIYLEACRRLGARPPASVALEDSPTGVAAAKAAGMYVIGVPFLEEVGLPDSDVTAPTLAERSIAEALGLDPR